jgi:AcrR family transcriptional regulator
MLRGEERGIATLSDIRALDDGARQALEKHYQAIFRRIRGFFGDVGDADRKALLTARAHMLTEVTFWLPAWIERYSISDFDRVRTKLFELLANGIAPAGARSLPIAPVTLDDDPTDPPETGRGPFLRAATRLINELGYRGASVDRIVAELNVTKGSFYHHLDAKDDLVLECFRQSYRRVSRAQHLADEAGSTHWQRISTAIAMLLDVQFGGTWPLLRTTALHALPADVRILVVERSNRMALRFAGMLVDGIGEGSIRPIDPMIASQIVMATLNAAYDLRHWAQRLPRAKAVAMYASTLTTGLFD